MNMGSADYSSQEKLDQLLDSGRITDEDYFRLSEALRPDPITEDVNQSRSETRRKLRKSWKNRQIEGVCGGIADYFGIDSTLVRVIAVVLLFFAFPFVLITYIALSLFLPWDDEAAASEPMRQGHPWLFAALGMLVVTIVPWAFSQFLLPRIINIFEELGAELPSLSQIAISIGSSYRFETPWISFPWGILLSLIFVAIATLLYLVCHNRKLRLAFNAIFFCLCISWALLIIVGSYLALWSLSQTIR